MAPSPVQTPLPSKSLHPPALGPGLAALFLRCSGARNSPSSLGNEGQWISSLRIHQGREPTCKRSTQEHASTKKEREQDLPTSLVLPVLRACIYIHIYNPIPSHYTTTTTTAKLTVTTSNAITIPTLQLSSSDSPPYKLTSPPNIPFPNISQQEGDNVLQTLRKPDFSTLTSKTPFSSSSSSCCILRLQQW